jgi:hypothetical protein
LIGGAGTARAPCAEAGLGLSEASLPAGWRRGYAADCKSAILPNEINALAVNPHRDIPATKPERDTRPAPRFKLTRDRHLRAVRMVGYALQADFAHTWAGLSFVLGVHLTRDELARLAHAILVALDDDDRADVCHVALTGELPPADPWATPELLAACVEYRADSARREGRAA